MFCGSVKTTGKAIASIGFLFVCSFKVSWQLRWLWKSELRKHTTDTWDSWYGDKKLQDEVINVALVTLYHSGNSANTKWFAGTIFETILARSLGRLSLLHCCLTACQVTGQIDNASSFFSSSHAQSCQRIQLLPLEYQLGSNSLRIESSTPILQLFYDSRRKISRQMLSAFTQESSSCAAHMYLVYINFHVGGTAPEYNRSNMKRANADVKCATLALTCETL